MKLTAEDRRVLDGERGEAARFALSVVVRMAEAAGAERLLSIEQAMLTLVVVTHQAVVAGRLTIFA